MVGSGRYYNGFTLCLLSGKNVEHHDGPIYVLSFKYQTLCLGPHVYVTFTGDRHQTPVFQYHRLPARLALPLRRRLQ